MREETEARPGSTAKEPALQSLWQWLAIGVLVCCWIAEASLCAERGF